ncbi:uncharacterized protein EDB91DRAFT_1050737 [Suillus paluster]|uniref:uncharacterized protein n=1 Tax=Suillus paluster TaxID=48578 RepID=UPI001B85F493|nr:uncharacterized protein EDB91DRAFT_1050737 [Suillus paluster]KAG1744070.1 hypothetical protein EDB91DRAFT_1050737 [Suillus paluster]
MFYARPNRAHKSPSIIVGLPHNRKPLQYLGFASIDHCEDVLNTINPSYFRKTQPQPGAYQDPDPRQEAQKARHLSKYIFPLQYGLSNVFSQKSAAKKMYKQPNFANRETDIEVRGGLSRHADDLGTCKTPRRLKNVLVLLEKMIWRHGKCGYKPLRDIACPSKVNKLSGLWCAPVSPSLLDYDDGQQNHGQ